MRNSILVLIALALLASGSVEARSRRHHEEPEQTQPQTQQQTGQISSNGVMWGAGVFSMGLNTGGAFAPSQLPAAGCFAVAQTNTPATPPVVYYGYNTTYVQQPTYYGATPQPTYYQYNGASPNPNAAWPQSPNAVGFTATGQQGLFSPNTSSGWTLGNQNNMFPTTTTGGLTGTQTSR